MFFFYSQKEDSTGDEDDDDKEDERDDEEEEEEGDISDEDDQPEESGESLGATSPVPETEVSKDKKRGKEQIISILYAKHVMRNCMCITEMLITQNLQYYDLNVWYL